VRAAANYGLPVQLAAAMALTRAVPLPEPAVMTRAASVRPAPAAPAATDARRLSRAVAHGDEEAFRQLYDAYSDRVLRLAILLARGDASLARDAAQAVWLVAARKMRPLESEAHLWNWLALFPGAPVGLAKVNGKQRLIFPRQGDEARFVVPL